MITDLLISKDGKEYKKGAIDFHAVASLIEEDSDTILITYNSGVKEYISVSYDDFLKAIAFSKYADISCKKTLIIHSILQEGKPKKPSTRSRSS